MEILKQMFTGKTYWIRRHLLKGSNVSFFAPVRVSPGPKCLFITKITGGRQGFFAPAEIPACRTEMPASTFRVWGSTLNLIFFWLMNMPRVGRED